MNIQSQTNIETYRTPDSNWEYIFKKNISNDEIDEIMDFASKVDLFPVEQSPVWNQLMESKNTTYFICKQENKIQCFAIIHESVFSFLKFSRIYFGPIFINKDALISCIGEIIKYYKKNHFLYLGIQLAMPTGSDADYIEYQLNKSHKIKYLFDDQNWSSLIVNLDRDENEILKSFSRGHNRSIKKSLHLGIKTFRISSFEDMTQFARIFHKMNIAKGLNSTSYDKIAIRFEKIYKYISLSNNNGFGIIVKDINNVVVGGLVILKQGKYWRHYVMASDPERKDIPILHTVIYESILMAKKIGLNYLDLWGYNLYVDEDDQKYYINRFKMGFTDQFIFFPKRMHIDLFPWGYELLRLAEWIRKFMK